MGCVLVCICCTPCPSQDEALSPKERGRARAGSSTNHPPHREKIPGHAMGELKKKPKTHTQQKQKKITHRRHEIPVSFSKCYYPRAADKVHSLSQHLERCSGLDPELSLNTDSPGGRHNPLLKETLSRGGSEKLSTSPLHPRSPHTSVNGQILAFPSR